MKVRLSTGAAYSNESSQQFENPWTVYDIGAQSFNTE